MLMPKRFKSKTGTYHQDEGADHLGEEFLDNHILHLQPTKQRFVGSHLARNVDHQVMLDLFVLGSRREQTEEMQQKGKENDERKGLKESWCLKIIKQ